jgi:hypothetical protein
MELREKQVIEGARRMKMLRMMSTPVHEFAKYGRLNMSERMGMLYELNEEQQKIVDEFEEENDAVVYHVIKSNTSIGVMYSLLFVSRHEDDWENDISDIENGCILAYVCNTNDGWCSEFGSIGVAPSFGGLIRTW